MEQLLTNLTSFWNQHWVIVIVGLAVGLLAFLIGWQWLRAGAEEKEEQAKQDLSNLEIRTNKDRRSDNRRAGNPVEVELTDPKGLREPLVGVVSDRSRGGFCLQVASEVPLGAILNARPRVRDSAYSVEIEVRTCRPDKEGFLLGCQFVQMPPWNVLLLFG